MLSDHVPQIVLFYEGWKGCGCPKCERKPNSNTKAGFGRRQKRGYVV
jgi:hypothetical protein